VRALPAPERCADLECARLIGEAAEALDKAKEASGCKLGGLASARFRTRTKQAALAKAAGAKPALAAKASADDGAGKGGAGAERSAAARAQPALNCFAALASASAGASSSLLPASHQKPALRRVMALPAAEDKLSGGSRAQGHRVDFAGQAALEAVHWLPAVFLKPPQASKAGKRARRRLREAP